MYRSHAIWQWTHHFPHYFPVVIIPCTANFIQTLLTSFLFYVWITRAFAVISIFPCFSWPPVYMYTASVTGEGCHYWHQMLEGGSSSALLSSRKILHRLLFRTRMPLIGDDTDSYIYMLIYVNVIYIYTYIYIYILYIIIIYIYGSGIVFSPVFYFQKSCSVHFP